MYVLNRWSARTTLVAALLVFVGCSSPTDADTVDGTYQLVAVDGQALPAPSGRVLFESGSLRLDGGTYALTLTGTDETGTDTTVSTGNFTLEGTTLELMGPNGVFLTAFGSLVGNVADLRIVAGDFRFRR